MRDASTLSWQARVWLALPVPVERVGRTTAWLLLTACVTALVWLLWPQCWTPDALRHAESAKGFVQTMWQVLAAALALSAAIVTFSFSAFASSRLSEMGSKLSDFARSSGLLVGIMVGLLALMVCGAWLLTLPAEPPPAGVTLRQTESSGAVAACLLGTVALFLVAYVLRQALKAGDRDWVQLLLLRRIQNYLDKAVATEIERAQGRLVLTEVLERYELRSSGLRRPPGFRVLEHVRQGVVFDVRLRLLVRLTRERDSPSALALNPLVVAWGLGYEIGPGTEPLWIREGISVRRRKVRRIFKTKTKSDAPSTANDLDRLSRQGLVAVREDDEPWYEEVTSIYRTVLLHLISAWGRFGAAPGQAPGQDEVGLRRCSEDLRTQVREIMDLGREEMIHLAIDVPLSVGLGALEHGENGAPSTEDALPARRDGTRCDPARRQRDSARSAQLRFERSVHAVTTGCRGAMSWLDDVYRTQRSRTVASGFGVVFDLMIAAADAEELEVLRSQDSEWASIIPSESYERFDDLSDIVRATGSDKINEPQNHSKNSHRECSAQDGLRILRAIYRFGVIAWILEGPGRREVTPAGLDAARLLAQHFRERSILTFVAGRAIECASDRRISWWMRMLRPAGEDRVVTVTFIPALITAYLSVLMDTLPPEAVEGELDVAAEPWIEEYRTMLRDGINRAWPLGREVSFWTNRDDKGLVDQQPWIAERRRRLALALETSVQELQRARTRRIIRASVTPEYRELFVVRTRQAWAAYRTLGPVLRALGAPPSAEEGGESTQLVSDTVPKAGFVGEGSAIHIETYAQSAGTRAAASETAHIIELLGEQRSSTGTESDLDRRALANSVSAAIDELRETGYRPSIVVAPASHAIWSRLAADRDLSAVRERLSTIGVPEHLLRFVRAAIDGMPVLVPPQLTTPGILVLDAAQGLRVPALFDSTGDDLDVRLIEQDTATVEQQLARENPTVSDESLATLIEERLQELVVLASAEFNYQAADARAIRVVAI
jgi:hypothetical protein